MVWLDQVNAYGSMLHKLIEVAINTYHVPLHEKKIVRDYYDGIKIRYTVGKFTTGWQQLEKGIVTSCTLSQILFVMGIKLDDDSNRKINKRTKEEVGNVPTTDKRLCGRPYIDHPYTRTN